MNTNTAPTPLAAKEKQMRDAFQADLASIQNQLEQMTRKVGQMITEAGLALNTNDLNLAQQVVAKDIEIDLMQHRIDELAVELLAMQSPVAVDLRALVASLRISSSLERMGDLGQHLALTVRRRYPEPVIPTPLRDRFQEIGQLTVTAILKTAEVIATRDIALADQIIASDQAIDQLKQNIYEMIFAEAAQNSLTQAVDAALLARFYERLGDHSVSVAKRIKFLSLGDAPLNHG